MENQTVLPEDETLEDIVFHNRNKAYGAYILRSDYQRVIKIALVAGISLFCLAVLTPMIWANFEAKQKHIVEIDLGDYKIEEPPKEIPIEAQPTPPPPPAEVIRKTIAFNQPEIVEDDKASELPPDQDVLNNTDAQISSVTQEGETTDIPVDDPDKYKTAEPTPPIELPKEEEKEVLFVEIMPEFAGGKAALAKFLQKNLHYPPKASAAGIGGKVYVQFVIGKNGEISKVDVLKGLGFGCDEEAERVIKLMPNWNPGKQSGRNVSVKFTLPIVFQLE